MQNRADVISELTSTGAFELVEDWSAGYAVRRYKNGPLTLRDLLLSSRRFGASAFVSYENVSLSYESHFSQVANVAHFLTARGVVKGDRVAIAMRNYPEWIVAFWACQAIGAIAVALNAWWTIAELDHALSDSRPSAIFVDAERLERVRALAIDDTLLVVVARAESSACYVRFAEIAVGTEGNLPDVSVQPADPATILYTSGTTGKSKGAVLSHGNHVSDLMNTALSGYVSRRLNGITTDKSLPRSVVLQTYPFFHIGGLGSIYNSMNAGSELVLMYKWDPTEAIKLIKLHDVTTISGVPIVMRQLIEAAATQKESLPTVSVATSGGAPVPPDLIRRIGTQFNSRAAPGTGYGMTETTGAVVGIGGQEYLDHPTSVGRPYPTADVRISDDGGEAIAPGQIGELWIRGPNVISGYWGDPIATAAAFEQGWFKSGDLGYIDATGLCYIVDRKKDVIIRGGENIYCAEVEAALLRHPLVKDAAVVGIPHADYGEEVGALIVVDAISRSNLDREILEFIEPDLAKFKLPTVVTFTDAELPRTATGKVSKREIRRIYFETAPSLMPSTANT